MQIGRITDLAEPRDFTQPDQSTVSFSVLASPTQARQLLGHGDNGAERFVPIDFGSWGGEHDGIYELLDVSVDADPNLDAASLRQVQVTARAQNRGRQIANSVLLVRGDNRNRTAAVGVTGPLYRASVPSGATTISSFNAGPGGFTVGSAVATLGRNSIVRLTDGSQVKEAVRVATTANVNLSTGTLLTIDGVALSTNNRVLVKNQSTPSQNGIYLAQTGAWTRATDADGGTELDRAIVFVTSGTANANTTWQQPASGITIGTTAQVWQRSPLWGLRESARGGPVSITYGSGLAGWYDGACTITQDGAVVTGSTPLASGALVLDNGLIKVGYSSGAVFNLEMASGSPLAWQGKDLVGSSSVPHALSFIAISAQAPSILTNTPDLVAVRYYVTGGVMDVSIQRGSRTATLAIHTSSPVVVEPKLNVDGFGPVFGSQEAGSGVGYTSPSQNMLYASTNDAYGNRVGLSYSGALTSDKTPSAKVHTFGLHAVIGGGTTKTGDDQLYGMDRAWFAMLAQQTSAGVL